MLAAKLVFLGAAVVMVIGFTSLPDVSTKKLEVICFELAYLVDASWLAKKKLLVRMP